MRVKKSAPPVSSIGGGGDSITPASVRSGCWSVTINNPTSEELQFAPVCEANGWKIEGQLEAGKEGTKHYQGMLDTPTKPTWTTVKRAFPRAHIEAARRRDLLKKYVHKEETRLAEVPSAGRDFPTMPQFALQLARDLDISKIEKEIEEAGKFKVGESRESIITRNVDSAVRNIMLREKNVYYAFYAVNPNFISIFRKFYKTIHSIAQDGEVRMGEGRQTADDDDRSTDTSTAEPTPSGAQAEGEWAEQVD